VIVVVAEVLPRLVVGIMPPVVRIVVRLGMLLGRQTMESGNRIDRGLDSFRVYRGVVIAVGFFSNYRFMLFSSLVRGTYSFVSVHIDNREVFNLMCAVTTPPTSLLLKRKVLG
jgi:hypothetical protein